MSETRSALAELKAATLAIGTKVSLPAQSECERLAQKGMNLTGPAIDFPDDFLSALRRDLMLGCGEGPAHNLPLKLLRRSPLVMWSGTPPAATLPGLLAAVLAGAEARPTWLRMMIEAWLRDFDIKASGLVEAGQRIATLLPRSPDPRLVPWRQAQEAFTVFDAGKGPSNIAKRLLAGSEPVGAILERIGMNSQLRAEGRYFRAVCDALLQLLPEALRQANGSAAWRRAAEVMELQTSTTDRAGQRFTKSSLRFADAGGALAAAALSPWLSGQGAGGAPKEAIKGFLVGHLGDPRLRATSWAAAGERATAVMRSWLAEESLDAFFDLIAESNNDRQWRHRHAFWTACLKASPKVNVVPEVWVVLGPGMARRAHAVRELRGAFGLLEDVTQYGEQAVLVIKLGHIVFSEWSNVGPIRAWSTNDQNCPRLYQDSRFPYAIRVLRGRSMNFPNHPVRAKGGASDGGGLYHRSSEDGLWQGCAAEFLRVNLGMQLAYRDYMP